MRLICIYLTLAIPHVVFAMIKIDGLQILNNASSAPHGAWGYARNYSDSEQLMPYYTIGSADLAADFCSSTQRVPFQVPSWPRLKAYPGSMICPHYTLENSTNNGSGVISWYGTSSSSLGSWTLLDVLMLEEIDAGLSIEDKCSSMSSKLMTNPELTESKYPDKQGIGECFTSFQVPESISETTLFTVYWLWNTSVNTQNGFLLYTSCIDIEIILEVENSLSTTATFGSSTTTSYATNAPSITGLELVSSAEIIPPGTIPVSRTSNADPQAGLHNSTLFPARTSTKGSSVVCTASSSSSSARIKTIASTHISGSNRLSVYKDTTGLQQSSTEARSKRTSSTTSINTSLTAIPSQLGPSLQSGVATRSSSRTSNQHSECTSAAATASKQSTTHQASAAPSDTSNPSWEVIVTTICSEISVWNFLAGTSCSQSTQSASLVTHTTTLPYEYVSWVTTTVVVHETLSKQ